MHPCEECLSLASGGLEGLWPLYGGGWGCRVRHRAPRAAESSLGLVAGEVWGWEGGAGHALRVLRRTG